MRQGTTPTYTFTLPFDTSMVDKVRVSFGQDSSEIVCKTEADCVMNGVELSCDLTQAETFKFNHQKLMQIQLKIKMPNGKIAMSNTMTDAVMPALCQEVL